MMVVRQIMNVLAQNPVVSDLVTRDPIAGVLTTGGLAPMGQGESFSAALDGFLALHESGYDIRRTGEGALRDGTGKAGEETLLQRREAESFEAAAAGRDTAPAGDEAFARGAAREDVFSPRTQRTEVPGEETVRQETSRQAAARRLASSAPDRNEGVVERSGIAIMYRTPGEVPGARLSIRNQGSESIAHGARKAADTFPHPALQASKVSNHRENLSGGSGPLNRDAAAAAHPEITVPKPGATRFDAGVRPRVDRSEARESRKEADSAAAGRPAVPFVWVSKGTEARTLFRSRTAQGGSEDQEPQSEARTRKAQRPAYADARHAQDGSRGGGRLATLDDVPARQTYPDARDAGGEKARGPNENPRGYGEISLAASKYENSAARVLSQPDYVMPRNTDDLINEIVRQFTLVARKGGGEAHISLKPDVLGGMKLDLRLHRGEVSSFILVDNPAVKDLLMSRLTVLEQGLLQHGLSLGSFQVEVKDGGNRAKADGQDGGKRAGASIVTDRVEDAVEGQVLTDAGLPWMSTVVNVTV